MESDADLADRVQQLHREIRSAQLTLQALLAAITEARSDGAGARWEQVKAENERLIAQCSRGAREVDSAHAALDAAIKAAETDSLTGLPNRVFLWDRLAHDMAAARRHGSLLAVYFLDLDGLKGVNDQFGHEVGDRFLQAAPASLKEAMRESDTVCRIGGDEFIVLVPEVRSADVAEVGRKILAAVGTPCMLDGHAFQPSASIGCSVFPDDGNEPETLVRKADEAMYCAKRLKKHDPSGRQAGQP